MANARIEAMKKWSVSAFVRKRSTSKPGEAVQVKKIYRVVEMPGASWGPVNSR